MWRKHKSKPQLIQRFEIDTIITVPFVVSGDDGDGIAGRFSDAAAASETKPTPSLADSC
jgi:hypothetical protein